MNYSERVMLIYDGLHYDALAVCGSAYSVYSPLYNLILAINWKLSFLQTRDPFFFWPFIEPQMDDLLANHINYMLSYEFGHVEKRSAGRNK